MFKHLQTYRTLKLQNTEGYVVRWEAGISLIGPLFRFGGEKREADIPRSNFG